ncbi:MAG: hypothetical protein ABJF11_18760 [Reichenbachiella sp.]|uniref:hypothetical protein n=1 Tax=Reichenbachiella sp. TaxID=2184521 RepID=UPI003263A177
MKRIIIYFLLSILLLITHLSFGQQMRISTTAEKTIMGVQVGTQVSYRLKNNFTFGGFYQRNFRGVNEINNDVYEYAGASISHPIARCENIMISGILRGGLSNRRFVIVTPGIDTELKLTKMLSVSVGMSIRASEAAINAKLILSL